MYMTSLYLKINPIDCDKTFEFFGKTVRFKNGVY